MLYTAQSLSIVATCEVAMISVSALVLIVAPVVFAQEEVDFEEAYGEPVDDWAQELAEQDDGDAVVGGERADAAGSASLQLAVPPVLVLAR